MKKILVSECLYGGRIVRYDAGDVTETNPVFLTPRPDSQRVADKVMAQTGLDVTEEYTKDAKEALQRRKNSSKHMINKE